MKVFLLFTFLLIFAIMAEEHHGWYEDEHKKKDHDDDKHHKDDHPDCEYYEEEEIEIEWEDEDKEKEHHKRHNCTRRRKNTPPNNTCDNQNKTDDNQNKTDDNKTDDNSNGTNGQDQGIISWLNKLLGNISEIDLEKAYTEKIIKYTSSVVVDFSKKVGNKSGGGNESGGDNETDNLTVWDETTEASPRWKCKECCEHQKQSCRRKRHSCWETPHFCENCWCYKNLMIDYDTSLANNDTDEDNKTTGEEPTENKTVSSAFTEIPEYGITLMGEFKLIGVAYEIPLTGNSEDDSTTRIIVTFDGELVYETDTHSAKGMELNKLKFEVAKFNLKDDVHEVKVLAAADKGKLYIPRFNPDGIEATLNPPIVGRIKVFAI